MTALAPTESTITRLSTFARDIKISHTIFAMPWALLATFLAANGMPRPGQIGLILLCMVTARTVAMASNRLLDAKLDAMNPRTAGRAIPSGQLTFRYVSGIAALCALAFVVATSLFGFLYDHWLPLMLSAPVLLFIASYPLLKRFTGLCHFYLGAALALAPICAWIAIAGKLAASPCLIGAAVLLWTAGFDIIYACQDFDSDRATGVVSVPARIGIAPALRVSRLTHVLSVGFMIALGMQSQPLDRLYFVGVAIVGLLLVVEHSLVRANDLSKVGLAFFTVNGIISLLVGTLGIIDVFI